MPYKIAPRPRQRYFNNDGTVAAGCYLYTYAAGTATPKATYQDAAGTTPHANPIVLDAKGEALIYWSGAYKVDLKTAAGVQITGYPVDNYSSYRNDFLYTDPVLGEFTPTAGTGSKSVTGVGFTPRRVDILATAESTTLIRQCDSITIGGVSSCHSISCNGATGDGDARVGTSFIDVRDAAGTAIYVAEFTSYDASGFTYNVTTATTVPIIKYVAYP